MSGDILERITKIRYDELLDTEGSTGLGGNISIPNTYDHRFGNNVIYSKMVYGENYKGEKYRGKVAHEYKIEREYNENGYVKRAIKKVIDNIEQKEIGKVYTSTYEYTCE
jgi:nicotinamide mononucleotide adenylyltransferase